MKTADVLGAIEESNGDWILEHCVCNTCENGIDRDLFGMVFCDQKDSIAYGWNPGTAGCEAHHFRDSGMEKTLQKKLDAWYEAYLKVGIYPFPACNGSDRLAGCKNSSNATTSFFGNEDSKIPLPFLKKNHGEWHGSLQQSSVALSGPVGLHQ